MRRAIIVIVATASLATIASVAVASIPDSSGVIHGCYDSKTGALRVIDTGKGQTCAKSETALTWNQAGPQGAQGPAGPEGPAGTNGVSGYEVVNASITWPGGSGGSIGGTLDAQCPNGKKVLGGGWRSRELDSPNLRIHWSYPDTENDWWSVRYTVDDTTAAFTLTAYATCATVS